MLLLAIDTSGRNGSVALARAAEAKPEVEVVEAVALAGGTFSAQLVPQISELLAKHGHTKSDISGFAVVNGPGSFTGLRVGLAAVKALGEVLQKPIAAVSLLEAVASLSRNPSRRVLAAFDAGRAEVYVGEYELSDPLLGDWPQMWSERLLTRDEFLSDARAAGAHIVTSDGLLAELIRAAGVFCEQVTYPGSEVIANLGWRRILGGRVVPPDELEANYIRRSDAEIFSQSRH
jgi:tRNA threonylcarbamoyladenosine biosynthesis protein TsaB